MFFISYLGPSNNSDDENGPKWSFVIWFIGIYFSISFVVFLLLTNVLGFTCKITWEKCRDENRPKRHQTRRLGPM